MAQNMYRVGRYNIFIILGESVHAPPWRDGIYNYIYMCESLHLLNVLNRGLVWGLLVRPQGQTRTPHRWTSLWSQLGAGDFEAMSFDQNHCRSGPSWPFKKARHFSENTYEWQSKQRNLEQWVTEATWRGTLNNWKKTRKEWRHTWKGCWRKFAQFVILCMSLVWHFAGIDCRMT